jgi:hypothetical protein
MLKTVARIFILLLVVGVITAGVYFVVENNPSLAGSSFEPGQGEGFGRRSDQPAGAFDGTRPDRALRGGGGDRHFEGGGFSILGLAGIAKNLGIIALITLVVWALTKLIQRLPRLGHRSPRGSLAPQEAVQPER